MTREQQAIAMRFFTLVAVAGAVWSLIALPAIYWGVESAQSLGDFAQFAPLPLFWLPLLICAISAWLAIYARSATPRSPQPWPAAVRWRLVFLAAVSLLTILLVRAQGERDALESELREAEEQAESLQATVEELASRAGEQRAQIVECLGESLRKNRETLEVLEQSQEALAELSKCRQQNLTLFTQMQVCRLRNCLY